jgi:chemotaxis protein MotB
MMAFFLVMWITGQSQEVKEAVSGYFQDPWGTSSQMTGSSISRGDGPGDEAPIVALPGILPPAASPSVGAFEPDGVASNSRWNQRRSVHLINAPDHETPALIVTFEESSAELSAAAQESLRRVLVALLGKPNRVEVRAHASLRPLPANSPYRDQWQLCYARSAATLRYLEENGVEAKRIRLSQASPYEPRSNRWETGWQYHSDCVEIFLLGEVLDGQPGRESAPRLTPGVSEGMGRGAPARSD